VQAGDEVSLHGFDVRVLKAQHIKTPGFEPGPLRPMLQPPLRAGDYRLDDYYSFLISASGYRFLTDPGVRPGELPPADVLFLNPHHDEEQCAALLRQVRPRLVVPNHWDDFFRSLSDPLRPAIIALRWGWPPLKRVDLDEFERVIQRLAPGTRVFRPEIFRVYDLGEFV
jgi:L-ascorbate metabolism protein UlaG (beta-lactamase superfamily)